MNTKHLEKDWRGTLPKLCEKAILKKQNVTYSMNSHLNLLNNNKIKLTLGMEKLDLLLC